MIPAPHGAVQDVEQATEELNMVASEAPTSHVGLEETKLLSSDHSPVVTIIEPSCGWVAPSKEVRAVVAGLRLLHRIALEQAAFG